MLHALLIARFGLDQLNKKSNAIQKEIGMKMKVLPTTGSRGEAKITRSQFVQEQ